MKIGEVELALPDYQASDQDVIRKKLTALLSSLEGTYPMNRSYGINSEVFDYPVQNPCLLPRSMKRQSSICQVSMYWMSVSVRIWIITYCIL